MYLVRVEKWACWYCMIRGGGREDGDGRERGTHAGSHFRNVDSRNNVGAVCTGSAVTFCRCAVSFRGCRSFRDNDMEATLTQESPASRIFFYLNH